MNNVILIGNVAREPEEHKTQNGNTRCTFAVACQRRVANAQGVREADFIQCVAWNKTAEFILKYFTKGKKIALTGSIQTRSYETQDGGKRFVTEVLVGEVEFVTKAEHKKDDEETHEVTQMVEATDDECPF